MMVMDWGMGDGEWGLWNAGNEGKGVGGFLFLFVLCMCMFSTLSTRYR